MRDFITFGDYVNWANHQIQVFVNRFYANENLGVVNDINAWNQISEIIDLRDSIEYSIMLGDLVAGNLFIDNLISIVGDISPTSNMNVGGNFQSFNLYAGLTIGGGSGGGGGGSYTAGTGLLLSGSQFLLDVSYTNSIYPQMASSYTNPSWIDSLDWGKITGRPTSLSGYGISDSYTISQVDNLLTSYLLLSGGTMTGYLTLNASPTNGLHATTKNYVDGLIAGLSWKQSCLVATTSSIILSAPQFIDGVYANTGDRVLVKNQSSAMDNGIYIVAVGAWTRSLDADTGAELEVATTFIEQGTVNKDTQWTCTSTSVTLGVTNITFGQVAGAGTYTNGTGISLSGNIFALNTAYTDGRYNQRTNNLSDVSSVATARSNLGLGSMAVQNSTSVSISGGAIDGTTVGSTTKSTGGFTTMNVVDTISITTPTTGTASSILGMRNTTGGATGNFLEYYNDPTSLPTRWSGIDRAGNLKTQNGSASTPALYFEAYKTTGFYANTSAGAGIGVSVGGVQIATFGVAGGGGSIFKIGANPNTDLTGQLQIENKNFGYKAFVIKGASSQSGEFIHVYGSTGVDMFKVLASGVMQSRLGGSTSLMNIDGTFFSLATTVTSNGIGTINNFLPTCTIPAVTAINTGDSIELRLAGSVSAGASNQLIIKFAGVVIFDSTATATFGGTNFKLFIDVFRESATTFRSSCALIDSNGTTIGLIKVDNITGGSCTWANANSFTAEGTSTAVTINSGRGRFSLA